MKIEILNKAVKLADELGRVFITTAAANGMPHTAAAGRLTNVSAGRVAVEEWFCPGTMANLQENRLMGIVVWDSASDTGYQLLGESVKIEDVAVLDGFLPDKKNKSPLPQVKRKLLVRIDKALSFKLAPHSDKEV